MNGRRVAGALASAALAAAAVTACSHAAAPPRPAAHPPASTPGIYALLPFSQNELALARTSAQRAAAGYQTFSYADTPQTYEGRLSPYVTAQYGAYLEQLFGNQTATAARNSAHEKSTATSAVQSIRTFGPTSITFVVYIAQHDPDTNESGSYAVTVATTDGTQWQVSDIEPAAAGNS
jgi:hypothetical protein